MGDHVYERPSEPDKGLVITVISEPSEFSRPNNSIWCWSHGSWEPVPDSWYEREETLRSEVEQEWGRIRRDGDRHAFQSNQLTAWIGKYCWHRGWGVPDIANRYEVFRFINSLKQEKPVR